MMNIEDKIFNILCDFEFFTEEELILVTRGWGDNIDTYNTICYVRYGMDFDQLMEENKIIY